MSGVLEALAKLLMEFNLRRAIGLVVLLVLLAGGVFAYESLTSNFRLNRIERIAQINERLSRLDTARLNTDPSLREIHARMKAELRAAANTPPSLRSWAPTVPDAVTGVKRFLSGAVIWFLMSLGVYSSAKNEVEGKSRKRRGRPLPEPEATIRLEKATHGASVGTVIALFSGIISIFLPLKDEWWFLVFVYPLVVLIAGMGIAGMVELAERNRRTLPVSAPPTSL